MRRVLGKLPSRWASHNIYLQGAFYQMLMFFSFFAQETMSEIALLIGKSLFMIPILKLINWVYIQLTPSKTVFYCLKLYCLKLWTPVLKLSGQNFAFSSLFVFEKVKSPEKNLVCKYISVVENSSLYLPSISQVKYLWVGRFNAAVQISVFSCRAIACSDDVDELELVSSDSKPSSSVV